MPSTYTTRLAGPLNSWPTMLDMDTDDMNIALTEVNAVTAYEFDCVRQQHRQRAERLGAVLRLQRTYRGHQGRTRYGRCLREAAEQLDTFMSHLTELLAAYSESHVALTLKDLVGMSPQQQRVVLADCVRVKEPFLSECCKRLPALTIDSRQRMQDRLNSRMSQPRCRRTQSTKRRKSSMAHMGVGVSLLPRRAEHGRVAMIIDSSTYPKVSIGQASDGADVCADVTAALRSRGFLALKARDLGLERLREALEVFCALLRAGSVGLLYYRGLVGHVVGGAHYLLPSDCPRDVRPETADWEAYSVADLYANLAVPKDLMSVVVLEHTGRVGPAEGEALPEAGGRGRLCWGVAPADLGPPAGGHLIVPPPYTAGEQRHGGLVKLFELGALGRLQHALQSQERPTGTFQELPEDMQPASVVRQRAQAGLPQLSEFAAAFASGLAKSQGPWDEALALAVGAYIDPDSVYATNDAPDGPPLYLNNEHADDHLVLTVEDGMAVAASVGRCDAVGLAAVRRYLQSTWM
eukprot:TRINITY_DN47955_c0_g1_i1.p1 TRINITY_DN47955_c0_g1~~TRINITY_DN47955_c0_g1_i1.p1  ORF type:complete len:557 (+),score=59.58 TRINITY_DN47955_c0_g1_i1:110-1672(+)